MGTTTEKFQKLIQTKADIKAALTEKGQTVGDVFSEYPAAVRAIAAATGGCVEFYSVYRKSSYELKFLNFTEDLRQKMFYIGPLIGDVKYNEIETEYGDIPYIHAIISAAVFGDINEDMDNGVIVSIGNNKDESSEYRERIDVSFFDTDACNIDKDGITFDALIGAFPSNTVYFALIFGDIQLKKKEVKLIVKTEFSGNLDTIRVYVNTKQVDEFYNNDSNPHEYTVNAGDDIRVAALGNNMSKLKEYTGLECVKTTTYLVYGIVVGTEDVPVIFN